MIKILFILFLFLSGVIKAEVTEEHIEPIVDSSTLIENLDEILNSSDILLNSETVSNSKRGRTMDDDWHHFMDDLMEMPMNPSKSRHDKKRDSFHYRRHNLTRHESHKKKDHILHPQKPTPKSDRDHRHHQKGHVNRFILFFKRSILAKLLLIAFCLGLLFLSIWIFVKLFNKWYSKKQNVFYAKLTQLINNEENPNPENVVNACSNVLGDDFQVIDYNNESNLSPIPDKYYYQQAN